MKEDMTQEMNVRIGQIMEDRGNLRELKSAVKDNEQNKDLRLADLEKERAILLEKLDNLQQRCDELESKLTTQTPSVQPADLKFPGKSGKRKSLSWRILRSTARFICSWSLTKARSWRFMTVWEGKFRFSETQKEQAKADLQDAMRKFEQTLQNLMKARANDPNQKENITDMLLAREKKYQSQMAENAKNQNKILQELEEKNKRLEKELKNLRDKLVLHTHGKLGNQSMNERKLNEYQENEKRLQSEVETIKQERDTKIIEYQTVLDKERELLKNKCNEMEARFKESEAKRTMNMRRKEQSGTSKRIIF